MTHLHYAAKGNFRALKKGYEFLPGAYGFNLADVGTPAQLQSLPEGDLGLVWVGLCKGATKQFVQKVSPFIGEAKVYGFYLEDEPDPHARPEEHRRACPASDLRAEADWIHSHAPRARTFIVLENLGSEEAPRYPGVYAPSSTDIDLFGLDPYPCRREYGGCRVSNIEASVEAAETAGFARETLVPVYQAFSYRDEWTMPTAAQEERILMTWGALLPAPVFDYAYSWGREGGQALVDESAQREVFAAHNRG